MKTKTSKKLLSIILSIVMLMSAMPFGISAFAEDGGFVCPEDNKSDAVIAEYAANHNHDNAVPFRYTHGAVPAGNYYLDGDVTLTGSLTFSGEVNLCLNGCVLNVNGDNSIYVTGEGSVLNIYDCGDTVPHYFRASDDGSWALDEASGNKVVYGGVITGGNSDTEDTSCLLSTIYLYGGTTLNVIKGNFVGNRLSADLFLIFGLSNSTINIYSSKLCGNYSNGSNTSNFINVRAESKLFLGKYVDIEYNTLKPTTSTSGCALINVGMDCVIESFAKISNNDCAYAYRNTGGTLTINGPISDNINCGILFKESGTATINSTISNNRSSKASIDIGGDTNVYLNGSIKNNSTTNAMTVNVNQGTLYLNGTISGNNAGTRIVNICNKGKLVMKAGAVIEGNTVADETNEYSAKCILMRNNGSYIHFDEMPADGVMYELVFQNGHANTIITVDPSLSEEEVRSHFIWDPAVYDYNIEADNDLIRVTPHQHVPVSANDDIPAKCEESGWEGHTVCSVCGNDVDPGHATDPTGHLHRTANVDQKDSTCTENGFTGNLVCDDCGKIITEGEVVYAKGHTRDYVENAKEATDTEEGYTGDVYCHCGICVEWGKVIPARGHNDSNNDHKCDNCGAVVSVCVDEIVNDTGVSGKDHLCDICNTKLSDCEDQNSNHFCDICGERTSYCFDKENDGDHRCDLCGEFMIGYEHIDTISDHYCDECGISISDHIWKVVSDVAPKCEEDGYKVYKCTICHATYTEKTKLATGHQFIVTVKKATCTEDGYTLTTCHNSGCDYYSKTISPATGHAYVVGYIEKPSCTTEGSMTYICATCGDTYTVVLPATGHSDADGDGLCDACGLEIRHYDADGDGICDHCGEYIGYKDGKWCKWCYRYFTMRNIPFIGAIVTIIHSFVHAFTAIELTF